MTNFDLNLIPSQAIQSFVHVAPRLVEQMQSNFTQTKETILNAPETLSQLAEPVFNYLKEISIDESTMYSIGTITVLTGLLGYSIHKLKESKDSRYRFLIPSVIHLAAAGMYKDIDKTCMANIHKALSALNLTQFLSGENLRYRLCMVASLAGLALEGANLYQKTTS